MAAALNLQISQRLHQQPARLLRVAVGQPLKASQPTTVFPNETPKPSCLDRIGNRQFHRVHSFNPNRFTPLFWRM